VTVKSIKHQQEDFIKTAHFMLVTKSWWDTSGCSCRADIVGPSCLKYPALLKKMDAWNADEKYVAAAHWPFCTTRYKKQTDENLLLAYCTNMVHQTEFFIRKAIGCVEGILKNKSCRHKKVCKGSPLSNFSKRNDEVIERRAKV